MERSTNFLLTELTPFESARISAVLLNSSSSRSSRKGGILSASESPPPWDHANPCASAQGDRGERHGAVHGAVYAGPRRCNNSLNLFVPIDGVYCQPLRPPNYR